MKSAKEIIRQKSLELVGADVCRSRKSDPETSRLAARDHKPKADSNASKVLEAIMINQDQGSFVTLTGGEIAVRCGLEHIECARRLSDLNKSGLIEKHDPRRCSIKGTKMLTWGVGLK